MAVSTRLRMASLRELVVGILNAFRVREASEQKPSCALDQSLCGGGGKFRLT